MATESLMINPMHLGEDISVTSRDNIVESVLVSQYKPYLEAIYGSDIPKSESDKLAAGAFFDAATAYSTDETLTEIITGGNLSAERKVVHYIARCLQLTNPLVDVSTDLRKATDAHQAPYANNVVSTDYDNEMIYMTTIFYTSTQLASVALDMIHPGLLRPELTRHGQQKGVLVGGNPYDPSPLSMFLRTSAVLPDQRERVALLKARTEILNARAMKASERMIAILQATQAKKELRTLLGE